MMVIMLMLGNLDQSAANEQTDRSTEALGAEKQTDRPAVAVDYIASRSSMEIKETPRLLASGLAIEKLDEFSCHCKSAAAAVGANVSVQSKATIIIRLGEKMISNGAGITGN